MLVRRPGLDAVTPPARRHKGQTIASWLRLVPQAALVCCGIGALRFVEVLVSLPADGSAPLLLVAVFAGSRYWLAAALLGLVAMVGWLVQRALGSPAPVPPPPTRTLSREARLRGWGFNLVAGWVVLSILALIVMSETGTGPFARFATGVLGLRGLAGLATFLLGLPAFLAPLLLLAVIPWQTRWPLVAGMQAAVKPTPTARKRTRRR